MDLAEAPARGSGPRLARRALPDKSKDPDGGIRGTVFPLPERDGPC